VPTQTQELSDLFGEWQAAIRHVADLRQLVAAVNRAPAGAVDLRSEMDRAESLMLRAAASAAGLRARIEELDPTAGAFDFTSGRPSSD
jgi:hypothetical protein